jgi:hypothetical protein
MPLTFLIKGVEPPDYDRLTQAQRARFWSIVGIIAERVKQDELQRGIDRHGRKLKPVRVRRIKFRRSGRVVDGEPLMPHRSLSRTRRLLNWTVTSIGVLFYWSNGWAKILDYHRRGACLKRNGRIVGKLPVRDVFGISPAGMDRIRREAWRHWENGTMPERKIAGEMTDQGLGIELPFDSTATKQVKGQGKAKPIEKWTVEDFLAAGVRAELSNATSRITNTGTSVTGTRRTGIAIGTTFHKGFKFAK